LHSLEGTEVFTAEKSPKAPEALYVDMGTTNTRVWLMRGETTVASAAESIGIRDSAQRGLATIRNGLRDLIARVSNSAAIGDRCSPKCIVAAGMIGSNLGLVEVPHVDVPAGIEQLRSASRWHLFPEISDLPFLLVPGVRSGPCNLSVASIGQLDVMRGEETLCAGLVALGKVELPAVILNLGSHWKAIQLDRDGRIQSSLTTLSGELLHTVQSNTVLAGSLPVERPESLSSEWVEAGIEEQKRSGLARALFCGRLLDLAHQGSAEDRLAFVVGAFIASDLDSLLNRGVMAFSRSIALVGHSTICGAWRTALSKNGIAAEIIDQAQAEAALLGALRHILMGSFCMEDLHS